MTLTSALFGGGASAPSYRAGNLYLAVLAAQSGGVSVADRDYIIPFIPRVNMTLDRVGWYRDNTTAANVRVGLYSSAGALLTDCAVDTGTTVGWHLVDSTNVSLSANTFYWLCWNASADVAAAQSLDATAGSAGTPFVATDAAGLALGIGTGDANAGGAGQFKARTNAALLSSLTMSGFAVATAVPMMGVVPA